MYFRPSSAVLSIASKSVKRLNVQAWQPNRQPSFSACGAPLEASAALNARLSRVSTPTALASTPAVLRNDLRFMFCSLVLIDCGNSWVGPPRHDRPFGLGINTDDDAAIV